MQIKVRLRSVIEARDRCSSCPRKDVSEPDVFTHLPNKVNAYFFFFVVVVVVVVHFDAVTSHAAFARSHLLGSGPLCDVSPSGRRDLVSHAEGCWLSLTA